ncbi:MAG: AAA family ATPase [Pseudonocardiaceae bacterium]
MIVAMAGLPGAGKSTLAGALATQLDAVVLDKDRIRAGLFPPSHVDYTPDQNDFCVDVMYRTTAWLLRRSGASVVILDGCTYTRANQITILRQMATELGEPLRVIECICDDQLALERIAGEADHPAANRDTALYRELKAAAHAITGPKLVVDTGRPIAACISDCVAYACGPRGSWRAMPGV